MLRTLLGLEVLSLTMFRLTRSQGLPIEHGALEHTGLLADLLLLRRLAIPVILFCPLAS